MNLIHLSIVIRVIMVLAITGVTSNSQSSSPSLEPEDQNEYVKRLRDIQRMVSNARLKLQQLQAAKRIPSAGQSRAVAVLDTEAQRITSEVIANLSRTMLENIQLAITGLQRKAIRKTVGRNVLDYYVDTVEREYFTSYYDENDRPELAHNDVGETESALQSTLKTDVEKYGKLATKAFRDIPTQLGILGDIARRDNNTFYYSYCLPPDPCNDTVSALLEMNFPKNFTKKKYIVGTGNHKISLSVSSPSLEKVQKQLQVQIVTSELNPFLFDSSVKELLGPVVSITVKDPNSTTNFLTHQHIEMDIPWNASRFENVPLTRGQTKEFNISVVPLKYLEYNSFPILVMSLLPGSLVALDIRSHLPEIDSLLVVKKKFRPTPLDFCDLAALSMTSKNVTKGNGMYPYNWIIFETDSAAEGSSEAGKGTDYYIAIYPNDPAHYGTNLTFEVAVWRPSCVFRDKAKEVWSEKQCRVTQTDGFLTGTHLHCSCTHLSTFSVTQFNTPTTLEYAQSTQIVLGIHRSYIITLAGFAVFLFFLIFLLILRHFDVKERLNPGIHIMDFGDRGINLHYYLIEVYSGGLLSPSYKNTTANISLQLHGCKATSVSYVLREDVQKVKVLQNNGVDSFLVSSLKDLGKLERIRIWRDNHGRYPDWHCRKVFIRCLTSGEDFHFFVHKTLTVGTYDESTCYNIPSATEGQIKNWRRRYRENVYNYFNDRHTWLSTFKRRPGSYFTRCQRLAVAIMTVFVNLIAAFFFQGAFEENGIIDNDDLHPYVRQLINSLEIFCITLPVEFIIRFLFGRIRKKNIPTILVWPTKRRTQFNNYQIFGAQDQDMDPHSELYAVSFAQQTGYLEEKETFSLPATNTSEIERWIATVPARLTSYDKPEPDNYIRAIREADPTTVKVEDSKREVVNHKRRTDNIKTIRNILPSSFTFQVKSNGDHNGRGDVSIEKKIADEIRKNSKWTRVVKKHPSLMQKVRKVSKRDIEGEDVKSNKRKGKKRTKNAKEKRRKKRKKKKGFKLPPVKITKVSADAKRKKLMRVSVCQLPPVAKTCHLPSSCVFIPWFLCLAVIFGCAAIANIYGLLLGPIVSVKIVQDLVLTTILTIFITQPLLLLILSVIKTTICRKRGDVEEDRFQVIVLTKKPKDTLKKEPFKHDIFRPERSHPPLNCNETFKLKMEAVRNHHANRGLLLIIIHCFLMSLILHVSYSNFSRHNFLASRNIESVLREVTWDNVFDLKGFYDYLDHVIHEYIYPDKYYNGENIPYAEHLPVIFNDEQSFLVGVPRLRQFRIHPKCNTATNKMYKIVGVKGKTTTANTYRIVAS